MTKKLTGKYINIWFNRPTIGRNYSGEQKVNFESLVPFSKCLRAKIYSNINVYFYPQGCQTLLLKKSEPLLFSLGSWTNIQNINPTKTIAPTKLINASINPDNIKLYKNIKHLQSNYNGSNTFGTMKISSRLG